MFSVLSKHIDDLDKTTSLRESDVPDRVATIGHIETLVRRELHADAEVEIFGSSAVGTDLQTGLHQSLRPSGGDVCRISARLSAKAG